MINHRSLAILIPLCLYSGNVHAREIYYKHGHRINFYYHINPLYFTSHTSDPLILNSLGNYSNIKFGIFTKHYINPFVAGYARFEYLPKFTRYNPNSYSHPTDNCISLSYVGLDLGMFGTLDYGRNYGVIHYSKQFTEKFFDETENLVLHEDNNFLVGRADGVLTYKMKSLFGSMKDFGLTLQHQTHYQRQNYYLSNKYNDSWGASLKYVNDAGLTIIGSTFFSPYDNSRNRADLTSHWAKSYAIGCNYNIQNITLSGFYGYLKESAFPYMKDSVRYDLLDTFEVVGQYDFQNGVKASLGYVKSSGTKYDYMRNLVVSNPVTLNNHFNVIVNYTLHPNFIANFHYKINFMKDSDTPDREYLHYSENTFGMGFKYTF
ncbi:porin [Buchnera aphidicola]|uniref:porin n=1 Tax=Buchnera aphidicola TaxID=9 RepID=UPI0025430018|nr:porin [Buchnera aphidicola]WII23521.1 porin [Buchnera aphidicola (Sipha maydis)]